MSGDTYEVSVDESGQSQSCNFYWDDLVAQKFFDVNEMNDKKETELEKYYRAMGMPRQTPNTRARAEGWSRAPEIFFNKPGNFSRQVRFLMSLNGMQ